MLRVARILSLTLLAVLCAGWLRAEDPPGVAARLAIEARTDHVRFVTFSPEGDLILSAGVSDNQKLEEDKLRLWRTRDGELAQVLEAQDIPVVSAFFGFRKELYVAAPRHFQVRFYSVKRGRQIGVLETEQETYRITVSPDDLWLATGSQPADEGGTEKTVQVYDFKTGERKFTVEHGEDIVNLLFSADGKRLAVGSRNGLVKLYEIPSGKVLQTWKLEGDPNRRTFVALSPDGALLATALDGKTIKLYETESGKTVRALVPGGEVGALQFSPGGKRLAVGTGPGSPTAGKAIQIWNAESGQQMARLTCESKTGDEPAAARVLAFSPDGQALAASYWGPRFYLWDVSDYVPQTETPSQTKKEPSARSTVRKDDPAQREKAAAAVLQLARKFKTDGKLDTAAAWFKKVVEKYAGTEAAAEATRELEELGQ